MTRRTALASAMVLAGFTTVFAAGAATAQTETDLVGTWRIVSNVNTAPDGTKTDAFAANPKGMIIFDPGGHYVSLITRPDLPKFASNNRNSGTPGENKAMVQGLFGFFGSYALADKVLSLKVESGTWPPFDGTDQKRLITSFTADDLVWTVAAPIGGTSELHWRRVK
jgi:hypothetical protein